MQRNLDLSQGMINSEAVMMRMTQVMGRHQAHALLYEAAQRAQSEGTPFVQALCGHPLVARHALASQLQALLEPRGYTGESARIALETAARVMPPR